MAGVKAKSGKTRENTAFYGEFRLSFWFENGADVFESWNHLKYGGRESPECPPRGPLLRSLPKATRGFVICPVGF